MIDFDISEMVARLREAGTDSRSVEAKSAAGGLPRSLATTLSALSNLPGGGIIILGLDESNGFAVVNVKDRNVLSAGLISLARQGLDPPVQVSVDDVSFEGGTILVALVAETPISAKPCRVIRTRKAYLRFGDGDYELSAVEEEGFVIGRTRPRFDEIALIDAQGDQLDAQLVAQFVAQTRLDSERLATFQDQDLLVKTGVITGAGVPTVAGLIALGQYPQQFLPAFSIHAAFLPVGAARGRVRALDEATFTGPVTAMLDQAVEWVRKNSRTAIVSDPRTGQVSDRIWPPILAVRELVANAIVHRDLAPWSSGRAIELRMSSESFRITNPGGLYGVTVDALGTMELTSARNRQLIEICRHLRTKDGRLVEALATGIPTVFEELETAKLSPPKFFDDGLSFTAIINTQEPVAQPAVARTPRLAKATPALEDVLQVLATGPADLADIAAKLGISKAATSKRLQALVQQRSVTARGGRGILTTYQLAT